jgi:hypothetical protein
MNLPPVVSLMVEEMADGYRGDLHIFPSLIVRVGKRAVEEAALQPLEELSIRASRSFLAELRSLKSSKSTVPSARVEWPPP